MDNKTEKYRKYRKYRQDCIRKPDAVLFLVCPNLIKNGAFWGNGESKKYVGFISKITGDGIRINAVQLKVENM